MNENEELTPSPAEEPAADDDWRFAPRLEDMHEAAEEDASPEAVEADEVLNEPAPEADEPQGGDTQPPPFTDALDIEAALAAVSSLDDMLAEEEAREQARLDREAAEAEAQQQREARMQHPELFFAMPPLSTIQRGRADSVIPALALIALGAWLTFTLTTTQQMPSAPLLLLAVSAVLGVTLLSRWLASGRWAGGALFFGLLLIGVGGALALLLAGGLLVTGWPLVIVAAGAALLLTGLLTKAAGGRLVFPGLALVIAGVIGYSLTSGLLPVEVSSTLARLWPVVLVAALVILVLPALFRRRQRD